MSAAGAWDGSAVIAGSSFADVFTGFEFADADGFTIGVPPTDAVFEGGVTETRGVPGFYADGINSWHIAGADPAVVDATITFGATSPTTLTFSTRTLTDGDLAAIEVKDTTGAVIQTIVPPDTTITAFAVDSAGGLPIGSVEISVELGEIVIDGLTYGGFPSVAAATDNIDCLFAPDNEFVCVVTDSVTDELTAGAHGTVSVAGDQVTGTGNIYAVPGATLADDSTTSAIIISAGTVVEGTSLVLTADTAGTSIELTMAFDDVYNRASDLATVEASYMDFALLGDPANDASTFDVDPAGAISGTSALGCVLSGQVTVIDATINAYDIAVTVDAQGVCTTGAGIYDGLGFIGDSDDLVPDTNDQLSFATFLQGTGMVVGTPTKAVP